MLKYCRLHFAKLSPNDPRKSASHVSKGSGQKTGEASSAYGHGRKQAIASHAGKTLGRSRFVIHRRKRGLLFVGIDPRTV